MNNTISFYIPEERMKSFTKVCNTVAKNVEGFSFTIDNPIRKVFTNHIIIEGISKFIKEFHNVCDVTVVMPNVNDWRLLAYYEDGVFFVADPSKKIEFKNPNHGKDYHVCDCCGKPCNKASYVIYNEKTGEELQVGGTCMKKYGIDTMKKLGEFIVELHHIYECGGFEVSFDDELTWHFKDISGHQAVLADNMIVAAKKQYDINHTWVKGRHTTDGSYIKSETGNSIQHFFSNDVTEDEVKYANEVKKFGQNIDAKTEFAKNMKKFASDYYCEMNNTCIPFFLVKAYEESVKIKTIDMPEVGQNVKFVGKLISSNFIEGMFGSYMQHTIQLPSGVAIKRNGTIKADDNDIVEGYTSVKSIKGMTIFVDRIVKNPKRGINYKELA